MQTIYIVTSGWYSDYNIEAVFDSRELAEIYTKHGPGFRVEEYTLNPEIPHLDKIQNGYKFFVVIMEHGEVESVYESTMREESTTLYDDGDFFVETFAKSKEQAIKIATEQFAEAVYNNDTLGIKT